MVITGRRNGESRSSKFKKAPADLADFGRFFRENPDAYCVSKGCLSVIDPMLTGLFFEVFRIFSEKVGEVAFPFGIRYV